MKSRRDHQDLQGVARGGKVGRVTHSKFDEEFKGSRTLLDVALS